MGFFQNLDNSLSDRAGRIVGRLGAASKPGWTRVDLSLECPLEEMILFLQAVGKAYDDAVPFSENDSVQVELTPDGDTRWPEAPLILLEHTIRLRGEQIRVHKSDADTWPSDLHGHPLGRPGHKIDIYTGDIYKISNRKKVGTLGKKDRARTHAALRDTEWGAAKLAARGL